MKRLGVWSICWLLIGLAGCTNQPETATLMLFDDQEPGAEPYPTRMMLTRAYLRLDEGLEAGGFVLLDRAAGEVLSVSTRDRNVLVIEPTALAMEPPAVFAHRAERSDESFPAVDGKDVRHYRLFTNDTACGDVYAAADLLPDAVAALRQYHEVLAGEQSITEARMPAELRSVCDQADLIFAPGRFLAHGFPVRRIERNGRRRQLVRFEQVPVEPDWFAIPADYKRYRLGDTRP
ncbi:MAG TPA: hypothetical protein VGA00_02565 [Acidiferrobacterales bacterium]